MQDFQRNIIKFYHSYYIFSFGETLKQLHTFSEPFSHQSGASILQEFTFDQTKTKIGKVWTLVFHGDNQVKCDK